jgi:protein-S-isoprenylcysteine O-methyltransferase Ste14
MVLLPWGAHQLLPVSLPLPLGARRWLGGVLSIAGLALWIPCLDTFSRRGEGTPLPLDAPRHLVTSGLFGVMRNPIMAGELMVIWAEGICFASLGILVYASVMSVASDLLVLYVEEPELRERFGESYEAYRRSVPRWLPRLVRRRSPSARDRDRRSGGGIGRPSA